MSNTTIHGEVVRQYRTFISLEHGTLHVMLTYHNTHHRLAEAQVALTAAQARELAKDLIERAHMLDGGPLWKA